MHLPAGRARLDRFRLRRGLTPVEGPSYAATRLAALATAPAGPVWRPLGPFAIPHGRTAGSGPGSRPRVAGRVAAVAVDPGDPRHLLAGGGGVWESRDGGLTWRPRTDDQPTAAIGALAFAPGDPAVAYAGTGQGEALAALGVGLLRSDDGGTSWRALVARELLGTGVFDLLVDPADPDRVLAATTGGLWRSADGGRRWERRLAGRCWSLSDDPAGGRAGGPVGAPGAWAGGELLAGSEQGLHRSEDGGVTWRPVPLAAAPAGLDRVAVTHGPGGVAWVFAAGDGVGHLWRRGHPGGQFEPLKPPPDLNSRDAWHHWACAADPADPGVVWLGAAGLHRGALGGDGRFAWIDLTARPSGDSLPLGQHAVLFEPGDPGALLVAGEGGLYRSPDGGRSWRSLGTGLAVAEVDHLADHAAWLLAAAGDLGTLRYEGGEVWCPVGPADPALAVDGELVAAGDGGLVVSADGGASWAEIPLPPARGAVTALAPAGPGRLLAGTGEGELLRLERAGGGWVVARVARPRGGPVAGVAADPGRPGVAWAAWSDPRGGRVWRSADDGATWSDAGGGLPAVPAGAVVPDPDRPGTVFAATDAGVWWSRDDGVAWEPMGRGLPNAPALALALRRDERLLRAGLLGRGVWELPLGPELVPAAPALRSGRSPAARPRPGGPWWECPDIKVEVPPAPRTGPVTPVEFEDDRWPGATGLPERGGRVDPGRPARVHVQVHHRGDGPLRDVRVRVLAVPACLRPPDLQVGPWLTTDAGPPPGSPWHHVAPPATIPILDPGRSAVATFDWQVPTDLPHDICLLAVATAPDQAVIPGQATGDRATASEAAASAASGGAVDSLAHPSPGSATLPVGGPGSGGWGSGTPTEGSSGRGSGALAEGSRGAGGGSGAPGDRAPGVSADRAPGVSADWAPGVSEGSAHPLTPDTSPRDALPQNLDPQDPDPPDPDPTSLPSVDPADLVTGNGNWGCKSVTVLGAGAGRVVRLELWGAMGRGPFGLAAEGWVAELTAGLVLPRRLGDLAVEAGLVAGRVGEVWRPGLVTLVRDEPGLAGRLDLATAYAIPAGSRGNGLELWLKGMELDPHRPEPVLLLLGDPPPSGRGSLLLLDHDGGVLGGHTFQLAR